MRNIKTAQPYPKLFNKMEGPFQILKFVGKKTYKLGFFPLIKIHFIFYINLLHLAPGNAFPNQNYEE